MKTDLKERIIRMIERRRSLFIQDAYNCSGKAMERDIDELINSIRRLK